MRERDREIRQCYNVYVKSNWSASNFQNFVYNVQWSLCKIEIGLILQNLVSLTGKREKNMITLARTLYNLFKKNKSQKRKEMPTYRRISTMATPGDNFDIAVNTIWHPC